MAAIKQLNESIIRCKRCPRLVRWREAAAKIRPPLSRQSYWAKPLPGFGDPQASVLIVGLAPAAHGGNRTDACLRGP